MTSQTGVQVLVRIKENAATVRSKASVSQRSRKYDPTIRRQRRSFGGPIAVPYCTVFCSTSITHYTRPLSRSLGYQCHGFSF